MDRLAALFEQLPLPEVARVLRRSALAALGVGIVALVSAIALNRPFVGLGACIGLGLGLTNIRLVVRSVMKVSELDPDHPKRVLASRTLVRLVATTAVIIGLVLASLQLGFGAAGGVAVYYFLLLVSLVRSILRQSSLKVTA